MSAAATRHREPGAPLTHRQVLLVFSGLMLGVLLAALDQTIVATALPNIVAHLHGFAELSWVVSAYLLASTVTTPLYGKFSDLYGRKGVFQFAIVVFLLGSALSGLARNMDQLIAFRAVQGLGAGGLIALAMAIIGDIVSPRERGRYQGLFGAVFAFASVAGPLVGGVIVEHFSWRWVFYINLPIGIVALIVTTSVLRLPFRRLPHRIDYAGSFLLVSGISLLLLVTVWGGSQYPWSSTVIVGLASGAAALLVGFVVQERRASEPLLPPLLFRNDIFNVSSAMSFLMSMAMFGALVYLPFYFQIVRGATPTVSGLMLLPLMAGILIMSITSGRLVTRTGRYRIFPLLGTIVMTTGLITMTLVGQSTPYAEMAVFMAIFGAGMGMVMQNVILATQNAVDYSVMGTATSGIMFFRSLGAVFGTAMFGAIFVNRINAWLPRLLPLQARAEFHIHASASGLNVTPASVRRLPLVVQHAITGAVVHAIHTVFVVAVPFAAVSIVFAVRLRELPLRATSGIEGSKPGAGDEPPVELDVGSIV
ncbi:MAG TPA: MDR family MFS transporter [Acidimicrobiales bacterium]|nr:MDR family MFS transporter [Acidimicrobiales bacterium]